MTSNIGTRQLKEFGQGVGFSTKAKEEGRNDHFKNIIQKALKKTFAPEFLNRVDDVVMFNALSRDDILKIIDIELEGLKQRVINLGYEFRISPAAKNFLAEKGYDVQYGARPLKRAIQKYLEDPMAEAIIKANLKEGDAIVIGFDKKKDGITIKSEKGKAKPPAKSTRQGSPPGEKEKGDVDASKN